MKISEIEAALAELAAASMQQAGQQSYIEVIEGDQETIVGGNAAGLVQLALELVKLAQKTAIGAHVHIDGASIADVSEKNLVFRLSRAPW